LSSNQLVSRVGGVVFVVNSYKKEQLSNIGGAKITFRDNDGGILKDKTGADTVGESNLLACDASGTVAAIFWRNSSGEWALSFPKAPSKGSNFQESIADVQKILKRIVFGESNETQITSILEDQELQKNETVPITGGGSLDEERRVLSVDGDDLFIGYVGAICAGRSCSS
jgi:hypothetical protein